MFPPRLDIFLRHDHPYHAAAPFPAGPIDDQRLYAAVDALPAAGARRRPGVCASRGWGSEEYNDWSDRPYRSRTTVTIQLGVRTRCTLTIHDILGRQVALLADGGELGPGRITFSWDAPGAASGTYLVRLRSAGTVTTVPVQLLR